MLNKKQLIEAMESKKNAIQSLLEKGDGLTAEDVDKAHELTQEAKGYQAELAKLNGVADLHDAANGFNEFLNAGRGLPNGGNPDSQAHLIGTKAAGTTTVDKKDGRLLGRRGVPDRPEDV